MTGALWLERSPALSRRVGHQEAELRRAAGTPVPSYVGIPRGILTSALVPDPTVFFFFVKIYLFGRQSKGGERERERTRVQSSTGLLHKSLQQLSVS